MIINLFDNSRKVIINFEDINLLIKGFLKIVIICFVWEIFNCILEELFYCEIVRISVVNLEIFIYELEFKG